MTRIDFHTQVADRLNYTCRLIRKAHSANCQIIVFNDNPEELSALDAALWSFSDTDFLPHVLYADALMYNLMYKTPIILSSQTESDFPHTELLINLTQTIPENFQRFSRVIEIIGNDQQQLQTGRQRFSQYKQQGYSPSHLIADSIQKT